MEQSNDSRFFPGYTWVMDNPQNQNLGLCFPGVARRSGGNFLLYSAISPSQKCGVLDDDRAGRNPGDAHTEVKAETPSGVCRLSRH